MELRFAVGDGGAMLFDGPAYPGEDPGLIGGEIETLGRIMTEVKSQRWVMRLAVGRTEPALGDEVSLPVAKPTGEDLVTAIVEERTGGLQSGLEQERGDVHAIERDGGGLTSLSPMCRRGNRPPALPIGGCPLQAAAVVPRRPVAQPLHAVDQDWRRAVTSTRILGVCQASMPFTA